MDGQLIANHAMTAGHSVLPVSETFGRCAERETGVV